MSSSNSPCAACKLLRRKCTQGCVFAPYFPPDQPQKFGNVHRVFGASNVAKLLNELSPVQREDAVNSLAYEANMRLSDPVYGCVGYIFILQHKLRQIQHDLEIARKELASYISPAGVFAGPAAAMSGAPFYHQIQQQPQAYNYLGLPQGQPQMGLGLSPAPAQMMITNHQQQQQMAVAAREQEMMRSFEQDLMRFGGANGDETNSALALVSPPQSYESNVFQVQPPPPQQQQQPLQIEYLEHQHSQTGGSDEGRSHIGGGSPSS